MNENTVVKTKQGYWLQLLQSVSKRPLRVSRNYEGKPSKWVSVKDAEFPVDYRTVLHNEVVFDIDSNRWKEVRLFAETLFPKIFRWVSKHVHLTKLIQNEKEKIFRLLQRTSAA